jgi:antitoxin VapB
MVVSIKNEETERLARELAKRMGVSITEAITTALREQLAREEGKRSAPRVRDELLAIGRALRRAPRSRHAQSGGDPRLRRDRVATLTKVSW